MASSHARSRSPRKCRWEDQGWKCVCCQAWEDQGWEDPSVQSVPDFVEGRKKLCQRSQELKERLILFPHLPLKSQHVEKDDPWLKQQISDTVNNAAQRNLNALTRTELEARSERLKVSLSKGSLASGSKTGIEASDSEAERALGDVAEAVVAAELANEEGSDMD